MTATTAIAAETREPSNLFYQSRTRRPVVARAEGIYFWDRDGRRYIDGSSGAMVANIGHGNPRVLAAMRRQMEEATFAYRLHFENEAAETVIAEGETEDPDETSPDRRDQMRDGA